MDKLDPPPIHDIRDHSTRDHQATGNHTAVLFSNPASKQEWLHTRAAQHLGHTLYDTTHPPKRKGFSKEDT